MAENTEFKAITTQEEFDAAIKSRLERCKTSTTEEVTKKFEGYISPDDLSAKTAESQKQIDDLNAQLKIRDGSIADLNAKVKAYETSSVKLRVAHESGIPYELADKLSGDTEEDIRKDAQTFSKYLGHTNNKPAPLATTETSGSSSRESELRNGLRKTLAKMEGE